MEKKVKNQLYQVEKTEMNEMLALVKANLDRDAEKHAVEKEKLKEECRQLAEEKAEVEAQREALELERNQLEEKSKICEENRESLVKNSLEYLTQEKEKINLEMKLEYRLPA